jgi:hypothetical protein
VRRSEIGLGLVVLLVACGPGVDPTASEMPTAGELLRSPTVVDDGALALGAPGQVLEPGRYTRDDFEPRITFEVAEGWTAEQVGPGFFDVQQGVGTLDVIAVQFARPLAFADSGTSTVETASATDAVAALQANSELTVTVQEPVMIGERAGVQVWVETTDPVDTQPPIFRPVLTVAAGPISIASGRRLQVTLVETPGWLLAIMVGGSVANWGATLSTALPVVQSVHIGE